MLSWPRHYQRDSCASYALAARSRNPPPLPDSHPRNFVANRTKDSQAVLVSVIKDPMLLSDVDAIDEGTIVQAAIAGKPEAFAELFHRYYPMIYAFAFRLCLDRATAQDLAQETFIKTARGIAGYRARTAFRHWLYQICANAVRDWQRSEGRRRKLANAAQQHAEIDSEERAPAFDAAREALATLSAELRAAVVAVYFEELSHAEAARVLGCAEATVSWRIFVAKRKLKTLLTRHE